MTLFCHHDWQLWPNKLRFSVWYITQMLRRYIWIFNRYLQSEVLCHFIAYSWFGAVTNNLTSGKNPVSYAMTNKLVKHRGSISGLMVYYHCLFLFWKCWVFCDSIWIYNHYWSNYHFWQYSFGLDTDLGHRL